LLTVNISNGGKSPGNSSANEIVTAIVMSKAKLTIVRTLVEKVNIKTSPYEIFNIVNIICES
jgi:hypothetical protein